MESAFIPNYGYHSQALQCDFSRPPYRGVAVEYPVQANTQNMQPPIPFYDPYYPYPAPQQLLFDVNRRVEPTQFIENQQFLAGGSHPYPANTQNMQPPIPFYHPQQPYPAPQQPPLDVNRRVEPTQFIENQQFLAGGSHPCPANTQNMQPPIPFYHPQQPYPAPQQPPIPFYNQQQPYPAPQQPPLDVNRRVEPTHFIENQQFPARGSCDPCPVGPGADNNPTSHETSDNSLEVQRQSTVNSAVVECNTFVRRLKPDANVRYEIQFNKETKILFELNHHRESNLGEMEPSRDINYTTEE